MACTECCAGCGHDRLEQHEHDIRDEYTRTAADRRRCASARRAGRGGARQRRCGHARLGADLFLQQRQQGRAALGDRSRMHHDRGAQDGHPGRHKLRRMQLARQAAARVRAGASRRRGRQPSLRTLLVFTPAALSPRARGRAEVLRRRAAGIRPRPRLRCLQADDRLDPGLLLERVRLAARQGGAARHERLFPRQPAEGRHVLGGPAHTRRRDHSGQAHRHRRRSEKVRPVHKNHRRTAHRLVRRARAPAAPDLARADQRRLRIRPRVRQGCSR